MLPKENKKATPVNWLHVLSSFGAMFSHLMPPFSYLGSKVAAEQFQTSMETALFAAL